MDQDSIPFRTPFLKTHAQSEQFLANETPLKMIKNDFYFILKTLFVLDFLVM